MERTIGRGGSGIFPGGVSRLAVAVGWLVASGCDTPSTTVVLTNGYPAGSGQVIYRAFWQTVSFPTPLAPGEATDRQPALPSSENTAYVVVAPGFTPGDGGMAPSTFLVLQSRTGYALHLNGALGITVDDSSFAGNCAAGGALAQADADIITQRVFAADFAGLRYDAATCRTTGDAP